MAPVASIAPPAGAAPPSADEADADGEDGGILQSRTGSRLPLLTVAGAALGACVMIIAGLIAVNLAGGPGAPAADTAAADAVAAGDDQQPATDESEAAPPADKKLTAADIAAMPPRQRLDYYMQQADKLTASRRYAEAAKLLQTQQELAVEAAGVDQLNGKIAVNDMANGLYYNFHNALRKFVKKKQPFDFEGDTFELVKKGAKQNTYKVNGQEYTFAPANMPPHHVAAFAHKALQGDNPHHLQFTSAFFAVDGAAVKAEPGLESAHAYYNRALAVAGQHEPYLASVLGLDISPRKPAAPMVVTLGSDETEPPEPVAVVAAAPGPEPVVPSPADGISFFVNAAAPPADRSAAPSAAAQQAGHASLLKFYRKPMAKIQANDVAGQLGFAATLLADAPTATDKATEYAMYEMAATIYKKYYAVAEYNSTLELLADKFEVDVSPLRYAMLRNLSTRNTLVLKEAFDMAVASAHRAARQHEYTKANEYAKAALSIASKAHDKPSIRAMNDLRATYAADIKAEKDYHAALDTLKTSPTDPAASQTAGRWLCYRLRDWEAGAAHLKNSPDAMEAKAATADTTPPATPAQMTATAEFWNSFATSQSSQDPASQLPASQVWSIAERAAYWLHQAFPGLSREEQTAAAEKIEAFKAMEKP